MDIRILKQTKIANIMISTAFVSGRYETIIFKTNGGDYFSTDIEDIRNTEDEALKVHQMFEDKYLTQAMEKFFKAEVKILD